MKTLTTLACCALAGAAIARTPAAPADIHPHTFRVTAGRGGGATVWIMFSDTGLAPGESPAALESVGAGYDPRAIARRLRRGSGPLFDEHDLPVSPEYTRAVAVL